MRGFAVVSLVLLLALASLPARASVAVAGELSFDGAGTVAPVVLPFNFGTQQLGAISTVVFTLCFKQPSSPAGSCDAGGMVTQQQALAAPFFLAGTFRENVATGAKSPVNLPVNLGNGQRLVVFNQWVANQTGPAADSLELRGTPTSGPADNIRLDLTGVGVASGSCSPSTQALCLNNDRFKVQSHFLTPFASSGAASGVKLTSDTGYLFFFSPSNVEAVIKVLNACPVNNRYWVFAGGLTDVRTIITVTDTQRSAVKTYINPRGTAFAPVQDTSAFATCP
jgi:hypothetical protein